MLLTGRIEYCNIQIHCRGWYIHEVGGVDVYHGGEKQDLELALWFCQLLALSLENYLTSLSLSCLFVKSGQSYLPAMTVCRSNMTYIIAQ